MTHPRSTPWCAGKVVADSRDREAWLEARKRYVSASDVGKCLALPWLIGPPERHETGAARYERLRQVKLGLVGELEPNERMHYARVMEPVIIGELSKAPESPFSGWAIREAGVLVEDPLCDRHAATTDFWADDGSGPMSWDLKQSEFAWKPSKNKPASTRCEPVSADGRMIFCPAGTLLPWVPEDYQWQVQSQIACAGTTRGGLAQWCSNRIANAIIFERDERMISTIRQAVEWFWMEVEG